MTTYQTYDDFLASKITIQEDAGFEVDPANLHPDLYLHQQKTVTWALRKGRALIAKVFGLGKTRDQCEIARQVHLRTGGKALVVCPLGVKHQFQQEDGPALGMDWQYVTSDAEVEAATSPYIITNYERIREGNIDPRLHNITAVCLDEGSVLRSLGSKTYEIFERVFADVPYRIVATATPSPNEYRELIYYARFLGVMDTGQALTRWFKRDSQKAGKLTLHPHHEKEFWLWVSTWALFMYKPSDVGGDDSGYDLPPLEVVWHKVAVDHRRAWEQTDNRGQHRMFLNAAHGVSEASKEKRATLESRLAKMQEVMEADPGQHWLLWHHLEDERRAIEEAIPNSISVYGSQSLEDRESRIVGFGRGEFPILATKPEIAGSGCNFQHFCARNIFLGVDYKFQDFIQAIHRTYRFGQHKPVQVHIIYAESEEDIVSVLKRKWRQHEKLSQKMQAIVKRYGLSENAIASELTRSIGTERVEVVSKLFTAVNNDCVREMAHIADDSVGLIHTSIPFGNHYEYTTKLEDFGHNPDNSDFWAQMDFLIPELLRVTMPGRVAAIHVKDRILYGHQTPHGFMDMDPFSDECVMAFRKHGWIYGGRRTISTDVVAENNQTYRLGWTEMTNDASKMGSGSPEYLLLFRKPPSSTDNARADMPITKDKDVYTRGRWQLTAHSQWRSSGNRLLSPQEYANMADLRQVAAVFKEEMQNNVYDFERHVAICEALDDATKLPATYMLLPPPITKKPTDYVWDDIVRMRVLNSEQSKRNIENHVCPLPIDIVSRTIALYSNEGDLVLDPFGGLMTVPYTAVKMGRKGYGIELNSDYWSWGVRYLEEAELKATTPTLFDLMNMNDVAQAAVMAHD